MRQRQPPLWYLAALLGLVVCSTGAVALVVVRVERTGSLHLAFLPWNLALAWLPLWFAAGLYGASRIRAPAAVLCPLALLWLLFLPNAPYIMTDFMHLGREAGVPFWFDAALIGSFAGTGLLLGYASLYLVQVVVAERLGTRLAWLLSLGALGLSSVGIYLGRFLRLNSWDAISQPRVLLDIARVRLADPLANPRLFEVTAFFTVFLVLGYLCLYAAAQVGAGLVPRRWLGHR